MTVALDASFEARLRRYILGHVDEDERLGIEERLILDPEAFEALEIVEEQLSEEYLDGELPGADRKAFEGSVLASDLGRQKFDLVRRLGHAAARVPEGPAPLPRPSIAARVRAWVQAQPAYGWALATTAVLLLGLCVAQLSERQRLQRGVNEALAQVAATTQQNDELRAEVERLQVEARALESSLAAAGDPAAEAAVAESAPAPEAGTGETDPANASLGNVITGDQIAPLPSSGQSGTGSLGLRAGAVYPPAFALSTGVLRSEGRMPRIALPAGAPLALLTLPLETLENTAYRATILDVDGVEIYSIVRLPRARTGGAEVAVPVPAGVLQPGDYQMELSGISADGSGESVGTYPFRVTKP